MGSGLELGLSVGMVLVVPVGYPLGYSINMLLGLSLVNYFGTYEGYLFRSLLCTLAGLILDTVERYLVGLSLRITIGYPLEYLNLGYFLSVTLMGVPLWLWFVSESVRCHCCFRCLTDFCKAPFCGEVVIYCVPTSVDIIKSIMDSGRYCQLMELLTLELSSTCLFTYSEGSLRATEIASFGSMPFSLVIDEYSYRWKADMLD